MKPKQEDYSAFVEHPRYGRGPRFTGVWLREKPFRYRLYMADDGNIDGTAVEADLQRQSPSPVPVLYYVDLKRVCVDCQRPFIFFAEEQKHWYETLGFVLSANCIRCVDCRKRQQGLERQRQRYEELFHRQDRSVDETLDMADCCLAMIENGLFTHRQTERVRMLLNQIRHEPTEAAAQKHHDLRRRLQAISKE